MTTRLCRRCGRVGPRIIDAGGYVHFYCLTAEEKRQRRVPRRAPLLETKRSSR
jgi:hypothetical protein